MPSFNLVGLDTVVNLTENVEYPEYVPRDISASYYMHLYEAPELLNNVFHFKTTDPELTSSTADNDMAFKCEPTKWPDLPFSEGVIRNDRKQDIKTYSVPAGHHDRITKNIGVQWLAKNITGGYNNSDIFANEESLQSQYVNLDNNNTIRDSIKYLRIIFIDRTPVPAADYLTTRNATLSARTPPRAHGQIVMRQLEIENLSGTTISTTDYILTTSSSGAQTPDETNGSYSPTFLSGDNNYWATRWGAYDYNADGTSYYTGTENTGGVSGEWIQIEFNANTQVKNIILTHVKDSLAGHSNMKHESHFDSLGNANGSGEPIGTSQAYNIQFVTSVDGIKWDLESLNTEIIPRTTINGSLSEGLQTSTYSLYDGDNNIKSKLVYKLGLGGSDSVPLSNANQNIENISRQIFNALIGKTNDNNYRMRSSIEITRQRVNDMIVSHQSNQK